MTSALLDLDPSCPRAAHRIRELLERDEVQEPQYEPYVKRVAEQSPDAQVRAQAQVLLGWCARIRGDRDEADQLFRSSLAVLWGTGTRSEARGCVGYALLCLLQRRVFEALVLARRACSLLSDGKDLYSFAIARGHVAGVLLEIGDFKRFGPAQDAADELIVRLTGERRMILERLGASFRVLAAVRQGKVEAALRAVDRLESFPPPADPRAQLYHRAIALLEAGRAEAAMKLIGSARSFHTPEDTYTYELDLLEVRCQIELRGAEYGVIAGRDFLHRLEANGRRFLSSGRRLYMASTIGRLLVQNCGTEHDARRAFEQAGAAALERTVELEGFMRDLPQLHALQPEDRAILDDYRERFVAEQKELLAAVAGLVQRAGRDAPKGDSTAEGLYVCPLCEHVRGPDRMWLPLVDYLPPDGPLTVVHVACESCRATR